MFYPASGYKERVGEGFESRVTRWNPRKDVRVQGHARSGELGVRLDVHGQAQADARECAGRRRWMLAAGAKEELKASS
ncbi:hypothetical protein CRG98_031974 [Punica granatum]|uniref:Uncharacterized protein n=1 Tax=Punica granatum TaxID=22663 RepID=A0A2I0IV34_PUNGR|nr:hypothetical protein CRG98_031974 [Punica granatum]